MQPPPSGLTNLLLGLVLLGTFYLLKVAVSLLQLMVVWKWCQRHLCQHKQYESDPTAINYCGVCRIVPIARHDCFHLWHKWGLLLG